MRKSVRAESCLLYDRVVMCQIDTFALPLPTTASLSLAKFHCFVFLPDQAFVTLTESLIFSISSIFMIVIFDIVHLAPSMLAPGESPINQQRTHQAIAPEIAIGVRFSQDASSMLKGY